MKHNRNPLAKAISYALGAGMITSLAMTAAPVVAQDEDEEEEEAATLDRVQVTGSRIQSQIVTSSAPVTEIDSEEVQYSGTTRIEDLVGQYPQAAAVSDAFTVNPTSGFPSVSLRGLGSQRTLTLVNGHRLPPGGIRSEARDLNQVPAALVKRVEILSGGASAVYGSDAMAGVVNFVLDTDYTGFSIQGGYAGYQHDNDNSYMQELQNNAGFEFPDGSTDLDGKSKYFDLSAGSWFADGKGHAMAWVTYRDNDELRQEARDYSSCALNQGGTVCGGSSTAPNPNFLVFDPDVMDQIGDFWMHRDPETDTWQAGLGQIYNYAPINHFQRPDQRWTAGASLTYEINDQVRPYMDFMYANTNTSAQIAQSGTFFVNRLTLDCANDDFLGSMCADLGLEPDQVFGPVYVGKRNIEGGPRISTIEANNFRVVTGIEGDINPNWNYDVSFLYGRNASSEANENDFIPSRLGEGLRLCPPGSASDCVPYDVWSNNITAEQAAAQGGVGMRTGTNTMTVVNGYVSGDLGVGLPTADGLNISVVGGYEWREEEYERRSDANMAQGNFAGLGGPRPPVSGRISVNEFFAEAAVPLVADMGALDNLALDLGYRLSDYSTSGQVHTWKVGFHAQFLEDFRVRGGLNKAIRAASTNELFAQQQIALWSGDDPCAGSDPEFTPEECARTGVSADQYGSIAASPAAQYNQFVGGNPNLDPEEADTFTLGFVTTPLDGLQVAVDYFQIEMEDRVGSIGAQNILRSCGRTGDPFLCNKVNRNPATGDLWVGSDPSRAGHIENLNDNFGEFDFAGLDLSAQYLWSLAGGQAYVGINGTYMLDQEVAPLPGVNDEATYDCVDRINTSCQTPEWRHVARFRYSQDMWTVGLSWRHTGSMKYVTTEGDLGETDQILVNNGNQLGSYNFFDVSGSFRATDNLELTLGINNVLDKEPPLVGSTLSLNANSIGGYDQLGRYIYSTVNLEF